MSEMGDIAARALQNAVNSAIRARELEIERDNWKRKAEKLAGVLRWISEEYERGERKGYDMKMTSEMNEQAKDAIAEYEK